MREDPARVPRWPYLLVRATTASLGILSVAQAAFAGSFLSGHYDLLNVHLMTAMVMVAIAVVQAVAMVFLRRAGGPRTELLVGLLLPLVVAGQAALGMGRVLGLHVPLGALLIVGLLRLAAWAWRTPLPARVTTTRENPPVGVLS
jgi:hypothetical protein